MATRKKYKIVLSEKYVRKSENGKEWFQFPLNISGQLVAIQTIIPLDPYTEPDMEQVRKEAYQKGYETGYKDGYNEPGKNQQEAYQRGLNDAREGKASCQFCEYEMCSDRADPCRICACNYINFFEPKKQEKEESEEQEQEQSFTAEEVMRQYLDTFCKRHFCSTCPLHTSEFTCGRGHHFTTKNPISNEEVRRAYAKVLQHEEVG